MRILKPVVSLLPSRWRRSLRAALMPSYEWRLAISGDMAQQVEWSGRYRFYTTAFRALQFNKIRGDYAEFGCHGCATFGIAYYASEAFSFGRHLWAFDSFCGLPPARADEDEHPMWMAGAMSTSVEAFTRICDLRAIPRHAYTVVPGYYSESLTKDAASVRYPSRVALAYVDCDLYSSTLDVLHFLLPRVGNGSILAFDDYFCMSETQAAGERRAFNEVFGAHPEWSVIPFLPFAPMGMSFMLERKAHGVPPCAAY